MAAVAPAPRFPPLAVTSPLGRRNCRCFLSAGHAAHLASLPQYAPGPNDPIRCRGAWRARPRGLPQTVSKGTDRCAQIPNGEMQRRVRYGHLPVMIEAHLNSLYVPFEVRDDVERTARIRRRGPVVVSVQSGGRFAF